MAAHSDSRTADSGASTGHRAQLTTPAQRWSFLAIISLGLFLVGADNSVLYTALPELRDELHTTSLQALWIINAYPLVLSGLLLGSGTLGDKIGHRLMFIIGAGVFALGSLAAAFSPSAWFLVGARALLGLGAAVMLPSTLALLRITFTDPQERNIAIGIWGSVSTVGAAAGPVLGGFLLEFFWWGSVFLINVPVAVIIVVATICFGPPNLARPETHWDALSSGYALVAMMGLVIAIKETANPERNATLIACACMAGIVGATLFALRQRTLRDKGIEPLLEARIFKNKIFTGGALAAIFAMFALSGMELMTTQRFQISADFSPFQAGLLVAIGAIAAMPASIIGGWLLARVGFCTLIPGGFSVLGLGLVAAIVAFDRASLWVFASCIVLVGLGAGSVMSVSSTAIVGSAPVHRAGMASSVEAASYEFGTLLSVATLGSLMPVLYARYAPREVAADVDHGVDHPVFGAAAAEAYDASYLVVLGIAALVAFIAAAVTAWCFKGNPKEVHPVRAQ